MLAGGFIVELYFGDSSIRVAQINGICGAVIGELVRHAPKRNMGPLVFFIGWIPAKKMTVDLAQNINASVLCREGRGRHWRDLVRIQFWGRGDWVCRLWVQPPCRDCALLVRQGKGDDAFSVCINLFGREAEQGENCLLVAVAVPNVDVSVLDKGSSLVSVGSREIKVTGGKV